MILVLAITIVALIGLYLKYMQKYWNRQGIPYYNFEKQMLFGQYGRKKHLVELFNDAYNTHGGSGVPFVGMCMLFQPVVTLIDLDLIRTVLIRDFQKFSGRGMYANIADDPLMGNLAAVDGAQWKMLRAKLKPTFSSAKMKLLFPTILEAGQQMVNIVGEMAQKISVMDIKNITACYTTDAIAAFTLGIQCNSLQEPNNEFRRIILQFFAEYRLGKDQLHQRFPKLASWLHATNTSPTVTNFFIKLVDETVKYRDAHNIVRRDFLQLLMEQRSSMMEPFTVKEMAAQVFAFVLAGFETSSSAISFCLYELSLNPEIQERVREEIQQVLESDNDELTYKNLNNMEYLQQVFKETLRKHPPVPGIKRVSSTDYHISDTKYEIPAKTTIFIPTEAIHHDPKYFPNPMVFDPTRFSPDEEANRHPMAYLPFGDGPRNCIGLRPGYVLTLIGIIMLLKHYRFSIAETTAVPLIYDNAILVREPLHLVLKVEQLVPDHRKPL